MTEATLPTVQELAARKARGETDAAIAAEFGVKQYQISNLRKKAGIDQVRRGGFAANARQAANARDRAARPDRQTLMQMKKDGLTDQQIADKLDCSLGAVRVWRKAYAVPATWDPNLERKRQTAVADHLCTTRYALGGHVWILRAPLFVVQAAERAYERVVDRSYGPTQI